MSWTRAAFAICIAGLALGASAQQPQQPNPRDAVPDKMPNDIPYGMPITLERAQAAHDLIRSGQARGRIVLTP